MSVYFKDLAERAITTFVQFLVGILAVDGATPFNIDWKAAVLGAATAAVTSIAKSFLARAIGNKDSASLAPAVGRHALPE